MSHQKYLIGDEITESDWRLLPTLLRFDSVYHGHFKCNKKKIKEYDNLFNYAKELYQYPGISDTYDDEYSKLHYYGSHETINPSRVVPLGPDMQAYAKPPVDESAAILENPMAESKNEAF